MSMEKPCPLCGSAAEHAVQLNMVLTGTREFWACPVCGKYEIHFSASGLGFNYNHLASYLFYHRFLRGDPKLRYHTTMSREHCDAYNLDTQRTGRYAGHPVHMGPDLIENWYPKTFSERVDKVLLLLNSRIPHVGQQLVLNLAEAISALFVDRFDDGTVNPFDYPSNRPVADIKNEVAYMLQYLVDMAYISFEDGKSVEDWIHIKIAPDGYKRVDELQKYSSYGRSALVAMKFGDDTRPLREAIRAGIEKAGYIAVFIDEVPHNDFITPELLKHIRDSKFVVVDLSDQNNGAYFEEGYAMGLGKPVIQLCKDGVKLHFDIAQKNTIIWTTEDDIPEKLSNRIKATID